MKSLVVFVSLCLCVSSVFAGPIPLQLKNLVPVGKDEMTYRGKTLDGKECSFDVFSARSRLSASVSIYDGRGNPMTSAKFQLAAAFDSVQAKLVGNTENYEVLIQNESEKDVRVTLKLHKEDRKLKAVQVLREEESYIGFGTIEKVTCYLR
ncbi:hypothetical protein B9G69_004985 [Bdellovibrio sp. SKB1291214]|uniref:hypothetical protein n=1 Tax=Bdellovibrio sp. SKB1291214 TaxID=1732569 RepID=UPI000B51B249|nr:hypothetical protein [Bdellovibrio sp. SKB1291214]UYL09929.1 hypothetical protein B9G69_004985 [Bdellovibrio sp. SKB1291214]